MTSAPKTVLAALALTLTAAATAQGGDVGDGPSFACTGKLSSVEYKICSTQALIDADLHMARVYADVKTRIRPRSDVSYLVADQKRWLATRDACGSKRCIGRAYAQRIETLSTYAVLRDD